jgi:hypothetical protein
LCNGNNGTPDLRNRFIVAAGSTYTVNATGGSADSILPTHTHSATVTDPGHAHNIPIGVSFGEGTPTLTTFDPTPSSTTATSTASTGISVSVANAGVSPTNGNLPPYYALCYIMKT